MRRVGCAAYVLAGALRQNFGLVQDHQLILRRDFAGEVGGPQHGGALLVELMQMVCYAARAAASTPTVGSSSNNNAGSRIRARAISGRRR